MYNPKENYYTAESLSKKYKKYEFPVQEAVNLIHVIFGKNDFDVDSNIEDDRYIFYVLDDDGETCLDFYYKILENGNGYIYIDSIKKGKDLSGEEIISKVIQISKSPLFHAEEIELGDASEIQLNSSEETCYFSLFILKILSTGQSWYNSYGFFYDVESEDRESYDRNEAVRNMTVEQILDIFSKDPNLQERYDSEGMNIIYGNELYEKYKHESVQTLAKDIEQEFKKAPNIDCFDEKIEWYLTFLELVQSSGILMYHHTLTYRVSYPGGGKKRETRGKKRNPRKKITRRNNTRRNNTRRNNTRRK